jgi:hypothetical protein
MGLKQSHMKRRFNCLGWALFVVGSLCVLKTSYLDSGIIAMVESDQPIGINAQLFNARYW